MVSTLTHHRLEVELTPLFNIHLLTGWDSELTPSIDPLSSLIHPLRQRGRAVTKPDFWAKVAHLKTSWHNIIPKDLLLSNIGVFIACNPILNLDLDWQFYYYFISI